MYDSAVKGKYRVYVGGVLSMYADVYETNPDLESNWSERKVNVCAITVDAAVNLRDAALLWSRSGFSKSISLQDFIDKVLP